MNIENNLERNYREKRINDMKGALRNERFNAIKIMFQSLDIQNAIIADIKKEKRIMKKNLVALKREERSREDQKRRTTNLFNDIMRQLYAKASNNINLCASYSVLSHNRSGELMQAFTEGYLNLDLLHGLCYSKNVLLEIVVNDEYKICEFRFIVNPQFRITSQDMSRMRVINCNNMDHFYDNYAENHKSYQKTR